MTRPAKIATFLGVTGVIVLVVYLNWTTMAEKATMWWYSVAKEPEQVRTFLRGWGPIGAPLAFVGLQILQVIFAPVPGEASGFVGGYVFGTVPGFLYSSIGLTAGSMINFILGRILGRRYVRKWIRESSLSPPPEACDDPTTTLISSRARSLKRSSICSQVTVSGGSASLTSS